MLRETVVVLVLAQVLAGQKDRPLSAEAFFGRSVDVYGWQDRNGNRSLRRAATGQVIGEAMLGRSGEFLPVNPDSLRARIRVESTLGSPGFRAKLAKLTAAASLLKPGVTVPRNAGIRVTVPGGWRILPGGVTLRDLDRDEKPIPYRHVVSDGGVFVDPVIIGTAAMKRGISAVPGLPTAVRLEGANVRLQIRFARVESGARPITQRWDFRAEGMLPDLQPPRILGEMTMRLERVGQLGPEVKLLTIHLGGVSQSIDAGDVLRIYSGDRPVVAVEVLQDARDPFGTASQRRVHVMVRRVRGLGGSDLLEDLDPTNRDGYPAKRGAARDRFLREHAHRVDLIAPFQPKRGDAASNFVRFAAAPVKDTRRNREKVPTMARFEVRFSKPIDPGSVESIGILKAPAGVVPCQVFVPDPLGMVFRFQTPLGFYSDKTMRRAAREDANKPIEARRFHHLLQFATGPKGLKDHRGTPLADGLRMAFMVDPDAKDNHVGYAIRRVR